MARQTDWEFLDDRGRSATAAQTPSRLVAYIQAGATLFDHGIRPVGLFGSHHDGETADPAKAGTLPLEDIAYLGSGNRVGVDAILDAEPDLVVGVGYGSDQVYGLDPDTAKHIEEHVPVVVCDVGQGRSLADVRDRFTALARSLGAEQNLSGAAELDCAEGRLRTLAPDAAHLRILALSPGTPESVHLARPRAWPDLRALAECGIGLVEPERGPGANWSTVDWTVAASLEPDIVLTDVRANVLPVAALEGVKAWQAGAGRARIVPWNPEVPCSHLAHARFFDAVADAVQASASSGS
ncbi:ABC transporter substrate-binding protein [Streptomyces sp. NPDC002730]|uniref:ABC transporter substrate-binding protein n=1 Tax=Streptomyces sp. NPDC002730 TaxID=3364662 RepID=UPI0036B2A32C